MNVVQFDPALARQFKDLSDAVAGGQLMLLAAKDSRGTTLPLVARVVRGAQQLLVTPLARLLSEEDMREIRLTRSADAVDTQAFADTQPAGHGFADTQPAGG